VKTRIATALLVSFISIFCLLPAPVHAFTLGLEPVSGPVGSDVKIPAFCQYGEGEYYLYWGDDNQMIAQGVVESKSCAPITFKVPQAARGKHTVTLKVGNKSFSRDFTVTASIVLGTKKGPVDSRVTVYGYGFDNQEGGIRIIYDGNTVASGIQANRSGTWQYTLAIPLSSRGSHPVSASGPTTTAQEVGNKVFEVTPSISVNPDSGWVGRIINVSGRGFAPGESGIAVIYDGTTVKSGIMADIAGSWQASFSVPPSGRGAHKLDARGNFTGQDDVPEVSFTVAPGLRVEQASGKLGEMIHVGEMLLVTGIGFQANETGISVTFDGTRVVEGLTADANGSWSASFTVPAASQGEHAVKASGDITRTDEATPYIIVLTPRLRINPDSGAIGQSMLLSGDGFSSNRPVTIYYDSKKMTAGVSTDFRGNFSTTFQPPPCTAGRHSLTVVDEGGAASTVSITIESEPPGVPSLISPPAGEVFSLFENKPVEFSWSSVEDASGVVYTFELSQQASFSGSVIRRENLEKPAFTLQAGQRPGPGEYHWRVRAIDLAGNAGEWSRVQTIEFSGFAYLWIAAAGLGVILLVVLIVWRIRAISKKGGWSNDDD